jgi:phosphopantothenoylcysteine decarboxylase/phosphopantothenate--cysteine ligase
MHQRMWKAGGTQRSVAQLGKDGAHFVGPVHGKLASGEQGMGRMSEPAEIADALAGLLASSADLAGLRLLISAGPTQEELDPVRFLSNRSSGQMGYALAERAVARGAQVTLVSGPVSLSAPHGVTLHNVRSALEMHALIMQEREHADAIVMTAAVADYRPAQSAQQKLKKQDTLTLTLIKNPDILAELGAARSGKKPALVGFALETENLLSYARDKLTRKNVDLIVANHARDGLGGDTNVATLVDHAGDTELGTLSKRALADRILDRVRELVRNL